MKNEFCTYEQSLSLKELGFDEKCFGWYDLKQEEFTPEIRFDFEFMESYDIIAPLKQQVFRWFEENHDMYVDRNIVTTVNEILDISYMIKSFRFPPIEVHFANRCDSFNDEKAQLLCIDKLIDIVK